jgi:XapX domain-containing protein
MPIIKEINPLVVFRKGKNMNKELGIAIFGGWILGVIFTAFKIPLPVPPFQGLVAAAAVLLGQVTYTFIKQKFNF